MITLWGLVSAVGLAGMVVTLVVLARLSRKLGEVTKMPPYYRWFYVAAALVGLALLTALLWASAMPDPGHFLAVLLTPAFYLAAYHLPLAAGLAIGLAASFKYWSWLLRER